MGIGIHENQKRGWIPPGFEDASEFLPPLFHVCNSVLVPCAMFGMCDEHIQHKIGSIDFGQEAPAVTVLNRNVLRLQKELFVFALGIGQLCGNPKFAP